MEVKKSIVDSVQGNGSWENRDKTRMFYAFEISFKNGDVGVYSSIHKEQNKFEVGQEVEYEFTGGKYPKVKPHYSKPPMYSPKQAFGKSDDVQIKIVRQSMLKASIDFWSITPELKPTTQDIFKTANIFIDFVNEKSEPQFNKEFTEVKRETLDIVSAAEQSGATAYPSQEEDLPF